ncbi:MAG: UDP-N-acetylmuramoyl-L-alanine--D-glutamate ligase [Herbinix sp.]|nr:UDP-N-acetylmuramoyl-L-alanine--D-glutamate ligase [Herbinix sp.]
MQLKDKKVMVYGAAKSGISAAGMLQKLGAYVILFDCNTNITKNNFKDKLDIDNRFLLVTGILQEELINTIDLLIISPGVALDHPDILKIKEKNIPIWGEIELAYRYTKGKIIGITGTNGKTTTTTLVGEIMKAYFNEVNVVGNIGNSYSDHALNTSEDAVTVIELSSFQLETIYEFKPDISTILNITPDHLNRHYTMDNYIAMKEKIAMNQTSSELCILNYEDEILRAMADRLKTKVLFFSSARKLAEGLYLEGDNIVYSNKLKKQIICNVNELQILGNHNYENVMDAVGIAIAIGIPLEIITKAVLSFQGVEHRIEYVEKIGGVTYYNDSKGTNPDASIRAIQAMRCPTILIGGGYDKKIPFDDLIEAFNDKVKCLVLLGQTREQFAETAKRHGFTDIVMVEDLKEAVKVSTEKAVSGDAVLLSPACASWGMFENYEQRGRLFKEYVREML